MSPNDPRKQLESYQITGLDQVKALANPLRMRIIEALMVSEPMTTKQVALHLGEKPTRLYHHVALLEKAGLIELTHTKKNRGTTEKYYQAIARQFRADEHLFSDKISLGEQEDAMLPMIRSIFDTTTSELLRLVGSDSGPSTLQDEGLLSYIQLHVTQAQVDEVQKRLEGLLEYLQTLKDDPSGTEDARKYRLTLAHYPLDRFD